MIEQETVAILGLGLIGGSLARDLSMRGTRVLGYDRDAEQVRAAFNVRAISGVIGEDLEALRSASIVVLAVPVDVAPALLERASPFLGAAELITDVGSTKLVIGERASKLGVRDRFVGAHPMAGDSRAGFAASRPGLFTGSRVYLCPSSRSEPPAKTKALKLWHAVGADVRWTTAEEHDGEVAFTSHLPHLLSAALARTIATAGHDVAALGTGGRVMTRLAGSSPAMWQAIVSTNHAAIVRALAACASQLDQVRELVARKDHTSVARLFEESGEWLRAAPADAAPENKAPRKKARGASGITG